MTPELGHFALILAVITAAVQAMLPLAGAFYQQPAWMRVARPAAYAQCLFVGIAFAILAYAFLQNDFSVMYVANNSNSQLPAIYRFCAVWGAHEGSLLLWALLLSLWSAAVARFSRGLSLIVMARVLSVLGFVSLGFLLFLLLTSNPFLRLLPNVPANGLDLNPLLQDPGLVIHPPLLYMGYVGFAVPFAFAMTALLGGRGWKVFNISAAGKSVSIDMQWSHWVKPWTIVAWCFLTGGIVLGSWWAYRELGWGGWWFWDPVENASFLPWLAGTALIHSLRVTEKRDGFKAWTVLLAIIAFSLSLLGTFLVRSGVLISVHAFAVDPKRGIFMLVFLALVIGISLSLYAGRVQRLRTTDLKFDLLSRESLLLANNMLLTGALFTVLLGTLYPLIIDSLGLEKISVGPPYFNIVFLPFMAFILLLMGLVPLSHWQHTAAEQVKRLAISFALAFVLAILLPWLFAHDIAWGVVLGLGFAFWVILATAQSMLEETARGWRLRRLSRRQWGMVVAHVGVAVCAIGVVLTSHYSVQQEVRLQPQQQATVGAYQFQFMGVREFIGPNFKGVEAGVLVKQKDKVITLLTPQQRIYNVQKTALAKTAIDMNLFRDLYVALGEPLDNNAWSLRIYYKPFVRWIWGGGLLMILGGLLAVSRRHREHHSEHRH